MLPPLHRSVLADSIGRTTMRAHRKAKPFPGPRLYQQRALVALPILVRQARQGEVIFYGDLAREMGLKMAINLNYILGSIGFGLQKLGRVWGDIIPPIQTIVVNQKTKLPGGGGQWFAMGHRYRTLPAATRRHLIAQTHSEVFLYSRWDHVLGHFGLFAAPPDSQRRIVEAAARPRRGGESPAHRAFKEEILQNSRLAGLSFLPSQGAEEARIPSGDILDVCFRSPTEIAAVEVKALHSDSADLARGLFQCVKYQAVLEKEHAFLGDKLAVTTRLVLEGRLPPELVPLRNALAVTMVELNRNGPPVEC
jgi:hypothetical protein